MRTVLNTAGDRPQVDGQPQCGRADHGPSRKNLMPLKKIGLVILKLGLPTALFAYLLWSVPAEDYRAFWAQPKRWELLLAAQLVALTAVLLSFMRWRVIVLAFTIPFSLREALRLGFLGYLLNFISLGSVGGDVFKAILVARNKPEKRPEAVASVLLDRAVGLLGLVVLAWISLTLFAGDELSGLLLGIWRGAGILAGSALVGMLAALLAGAWFDSLLDTVARLPMIGEPLARMARAVRQLRNQPHTVLLLLLLSCTVHLLLTLAVFLVSAGVYHAHPTLQEHLMVVPPGMAAGTLPLAPGGIGVQEGALAGLFQQLPNLPEN
ncbi:MAG: flippase-like domain-containing protein, partial [Planctomycetales bacterium]|nr:flippase-like domain-containing protein [Planctomycetales bacterium]